MKEALEDDRSTLLTMPYPSCRRRARCESIALRWPVEGAGEDDAQTCVSGLMKNGSIARTAASSLGRATSLSLCCLSSPLTPSYRRPSDAVASRPPLQPPPPR